MLASMRGNLKAVELASEQYTSPPTLYSTMAVLSLRIFGSVGFCMDEHTCHAARTRHICLMHEKGACDWTCTLNSDMFATGTHSLLSSSSAGPDLCLLDNVGHQAMEGAVMCCVCIPQHAR